MSDLRQKVANAYKAVADRDPKLREELEAKRNSRMMDFEMPGAPEHEMAPEAPRELVLETIVLRVGRPVLTILRNEAQLTFNESESEVWRARLERARTGLVAAATAVGRVELENNPRFDWVGTGWLVQPDILVTNRHVAAEFGRGGGSGFVFRPGTNGRPMDATVDFLEEFGRAEDLTFRLARILHIEGEDGPDLAFLKVAPANGRRLAPHIRLATTAPEANRMVATIGYPARDSRIPEPPLMNRIFGDVFDKKRLAPGQITRSTAAVLEHDCSTLGGNSGSVVLDLASGEALGLHFAGRFLVANFAVPAPVVAERLRQVTREGVGGRTAPPAAKPGAAQPQAPITVQAAPQGTSITCTIPLRVTVEVGPVESQQASPVTKPFTLVDADNGDDDEILETEASPEDYRGRPGYNSRFLGNGIVVPLPVIRTGRDQVVTFQDNGATQSVLKYQHFSVVMNRERRSCFFSAVNIDGERSRSTTRPGWRLDPRIPAELQILRECYGNPPKFSRGHMTRREDPAWGDRDTANLGNADSMHVTNAVPQMQTFNGGIWLGLENYALQNARRDDMKICVTTGPFLMRQDPLRFGVKVPRSFWKVIAFIHDETNQLSATGYTMSQESFLHEEEFVFGRFETRQRSITSIEQSAGLSFGGLTAVDRFGSDDESLDVPLTRFDQIRFI